VHARVLLAVPVEVLWLDRWRETPGRSRYRFARSPAGARPVRPTTVNKTASAATWDGRNSGPRGRCTGAVLERSWSRPNRPGPTSSTSCQGWGSRPLLLPRGPRARYRGMRWHLSERARCVAGSREGMADRSRSRALRRVLRVEPAGAARRANRVRRSSYASGRGRIPGAALRQGPATVIGLRPRGEARR
jgi:hypothetical protein